MFDFYPSEEECEGLERDIPYFEEARADFVPYYASDKDEVMRCELRCTSWAQLP